MNLSPSIHNSRALGILLFIWPILLTIDAQPVSSEIRAPHISEEAVKNRLEALSRLSPTLINQSPKLQQLVNETAVALRNDPRLVDLATRFDLFDQTPALVEIASGPFDETVRDRALAFLISHESEGSALDSFAHTLSNRRLLARNGSPRALDLLLPEMLESALSSVERRSLTTILCTKKATATDLLKSLSADSSVWAEEIIRSAIQSLETTPWNELRKQFETLVPMENTPQQDQEIDVPSLLTQSGNIESGRQIFRSPEFTCVNCHVAEKVGNDFGPGLSEIGKKLGKDALYDAILNPSAGISFDYEGWNITLNSGDEITGIVLSRTEKHWSVKNLLGQIQEIPIADIFEKQKMSTSLMPAGLGALLGPQKLVDLVAYLSTLGK